METPDGTSIPKRPCVATMGNDTTAHTLRTSQWTGSPAEGHNMEQKLSNAELLHVWGPIVIHCTTNIGSYMCSALRLLILIHGISMLIPMKLRAGIKDWLVPSCFSEHSMIRFIRYDEFSCVFCRCRASCGGGTMAGPTLSRRQSSYRCYRRPIYD